VRAGIAAETVKRFAEQVRKTWDYFDCDPELRFAVKHGLEAYRDARVLVAKE
jgi:hypothetical protein